MKPYEHFKKELSEDTPANSMGGGFSVSSASSNPNPNMAGYDPLLFDGKKRKRKKFAGVDVFKVTSEDYSKSVNGRKKWSRWNKNMNMENFDNQEIRTYCHRNPGKSVIIQDENSGVMSYLIPPSRKNTNESVEEGVKDILVGAGKVAGKVLKVVGKGIKKVYKGIKDQPAGTAIGMTSRDKAGKAQYGGNPYSSKTRGVGDEVDYHGSKHESVELDEYGVHTQRPGTPQPPERGKFAIKLPKGAEKRSKKQQQVIRAAMLASQTVKKKKDEVDEGSFGPTFKTTGKDNEGKPRRGWNDFQLGKLNKARERGRQADAERKKKYDAMSPEEQRADDKEWHDEKMAKAEKYSR